MIHLNQIQNDLNNINFFNLSRKEILINKPKIKFKIIENNIPNGIIITYKLNRKFLKKLQFLKTNNSKIIALNLEKNILRIIESYYNIVTFELSGLGIPISLSTINLLNGTIKYTNLNTFNIGYMYECLNYDGEVFFLKNLTDYKISMIHLKNINPPKLEDIKNNYNPSSISQELDKIPNNRINFNLCSNLLNINDEYLLRFTILLNKKIFIGIFNIKKNEEYWKDISQFILPSWIRKKMVKIFMVYYLDDIIYCEVLINWDENNYKRKFKIKLNNNMDKFRIINKSEIRYLKGIDF